MENTGVPIFKSPNSKSSTLDSANINPFDCTWKKTMDAISLTEQTNRRSSIRLSTDFSHIDKNSVRFLDLNISDFGRESLGILPPDFARDSLGFMNMSNLETNRESLGILQISTLKDFGRESIGILTSDFWKESLGFRSTNKIEANHESLEITQTNALRDSLSFGRESLGILNLQDLDRESLACGRESLGILHLKSPDLKFKDEEKNIPDLMLTSAEENSYEPNHILDTAFLQPNFRKSSTLSSISSFNSLWLEDPSRIYSVSSVKTDLGSDTPISTNFTSSYNTELSSVHSLFNKGKIFSPSELDLRSRIQSVPDKLTPPKRKIEKHFWSVDRTTQIKSLDRSYRECIDFETDRSSEFHDSVFIKGNSTSENVVDGSHESFACGALDCTSEPEWPDEVSTTDKKENEYKKFDTESAFKTVDKMLPQPGKEIIDDELKTSKTGNNISSENVGKIKDDSDSKIVEGGEQNISKLLHNLSDIQHEPKKNLFIQKQPKEILQNLSLLLNCTNPSDKQKSEGQSLLNTLADMLCESKSSSKNNFDDSGHSSINEQSDSPSNKDQGCFEVLDLRLKGTEPNVNSNKSEILDLSLKSKAIEDIKDKRLSRSLCLPSPNKKVFSDPGMKSESASSLHLSNTRSSNSSANSNDSKNISALIKPNIAGKLRQKTCRSGLNKGPMKAIIPVGEMKKKNKTPVTPDRSEQKVLSMQSKRTSTPINEPKMKPIAASTPSSSTKESRLLNKKSADSSLVTSKTLNSSNTSIQSKADISGLPRASMINVGYRLRTSSLGDIKKPSEMSWRRNSVGKESSIMPSVAKARQNLGSPYYRPMKQNTEVELKNKGKLEEKRNSSIIKLSYTESKSKASKNFMPKKMKPNVFTAGSPAKIVSSPQLKNLNISTSSQSHSNTNVGVQYGKKNSIGFESRRKSCLSQIKQNLLSSPHFNLQKENCLNKKTVLSENQDLNKIKTGISKYLQLKKAGKENT